MYQLIQKKRVIIMSNNAGQIVVANRSSGTLSVINATNDELLLNVALPQEDGESTPEPMYVTYLSETNEVVVGDHANDRVVFFNVGDYSVSSILAVGEGVFHSWADPDEEQLWVVNDIDNTVSVIGLPQKEVIATIPLSEDLVALGGRVHDVFLDPVDDFAYVTVLNVEGDTDALIKYSTESFAEVDRAVVGDDPHLAATASNDVLYVPAQDSNLVSILDRDTLDLVTEISVPAAHGAVGAVDRRNFDVFYTTNIAGGGTDAIYAIDTVTNELIGEPVDTPFSTPHNLFLSAQADKLYVTHSGDNNQVSVFDIDEQGLLELSGTVTVGDNPFGLASVAGNPFDAEFYRFQSSSSFGSYLFAGDEERESINNDFANSFNEEGLAFTAASQANDELTAFYRFRSDRGYLLVGEEERTAIVEDANLSEVFQEEGLAFYTYAAGSDKGSAFHRLRNLNVPGAYLYATGDELANIQNNLSDVYFDEGVAFEAMV